MRVVRGRGDGPAGAAGAGAEPEILISGRVDGHEVRLRYAPKRDITPWEVATLLRLLVAAAAGEGRVDWVDWVAKHGLLRRFDPL